MKIACYNGSHWIVSEKKLFQIISSYDYKNTHAHQLSHHSQADIIIINYSATDHIAYMESLLENYQNKIFIFTSGENMHRSRIVLVSKLNGLIMKLPQYKHVLSKLYPLFSKTIFWSTKTDYPMYKVIKKYIKTHHMYAILCEDTTKLNALAHKHSSKGRGITFPIFLSLLYQQYIRDKVSHNDIPPRITDTQAPLLQERKKFCCSVFSNTTPERIHICNTISQIDKVDIFGNTPLNNSGKVEQQIAFHGDVEKKHNLSGLQSIYAQYQFVICFENSVNKGYVTEKIFNVLRSGAIPIYFGAPDINKFVNPNAIVYSHNKNMRKINHHITTTIKKILSNANILNSFNTINHFENIQRENITQQIKTYAQVCDLFT